MINIHHVIEQITNGKYCVSEYLDTESQNKLINAFNAKAKSSICFDMGLVDRFDGIRPVLDAVILPYETCWLEGVAVYKEKSITIGTLCFYIQTKYGQSMAGIVFSRRNNKGSFVLDGGWCSEHTSGRNIVHISAPEGDDFEFLSETYRLVFVFLSALNCSNVEHIEHKPSALKQQMRKRKGKPALFSYWTLHLPLGKTAPKTSPRGGTKAPPRLHLRRGHPRQYASGKFTWVQPCVVGDKSRGMVHKDYAAS